MRKSTVMLVLVIITLGVVGINLQFDKGFEITGGTLVFLLVILLYAS